MKHEVTQLRTRDTRATGPGRSARLAGFTLMELCLVLVIIAIAVAVVVPAFANFDKGRASKNFADEILSATRYARTQAIASGLSYRLNLDVSNRTFWLTVQDPSGTTFNPLGEEFGRVTAAPDGVTLNWDAPQNQDGQYIEFRPTGRTDPTTIRVADQGGNVVEITCPSATELFQIVK